MEKDFYKKAQDYWDSQDATVNGMLGGFSQISTHEITSSRQFLSEIYKLKPCPTKSYAVDCGAGIGRWLEVSALKYNGRSKLSILSE